MSHLSDRTQAVMLLEKLLQQQLSLTQCFNQDTSPFTKAICFGVCRHYHRLQVIADYLCPKKQKSLSVWLVLLVGLFQLLYIDKPAYATVQETVRVLEKLKLGWAKSFINGVLRRFCREQTTIIEAIRQQPEYIWGHPDWMLSLFQRDWPDDWSSLVVANDAHPPMSLRVNLQKLSRHSYLQQLLNQGWQAEPLPYAPAGITLHSPCTAEDLPGFVHGEVAIQDQAAQLVVPLLELEPGLRVLDACAAPGGKTCYILESEPELQACVALDINEKRLPYIQSNLKRLGLSAIVKQGDASQPESWWDGKMFDRILLDAPCSALGVIRRHPDIKLLRSAEHIQEVVVTQHKLLRSLWPLLNPGGILVYATCSVLRCENQQQIACFLADYPDAKLVEHASPWGRWTGYGWQILPGDHDMDGFFYAPLKKLCK